MSIYVFSSFDRSKQADFHPINSFQEWIQIILVSNQDWAVFRVQKISNSICIEFM